MKQQFKYIIIFFCLFGYNTIQAHESRPLFIQIKEQSDFSLTVKLNVPNTVSQNNLPYLVFPDNYQINEAKNQVLLNASGYIIKYVFTSSISNLKGQRIKIIYPKFNPSITSIIQLEFNNEQQQTIVLGPEKNEFIIAQEASSLEVAKQYTWLGITHIWAGIDHLLFLVCLLIITGFNKKLFWTITGFTIAHSITLILSTLGWIQLPIKPIEACIALSIIFLCLEIIKHHKTKSSITYKYPVLVSSAFGFLHGFGFASVLSDIGLPESNLLSALLFFNMGVEIGQLLFIACVFAINFFIIKRIIKVYNNSNYVFTTAIYSVGILASFWFFDRLF